ncbi:EamA/RhaT family transporter [Castellaniella sp. GW247-6E4]|uniref:EamA family transporter n=1 Tax=Castellaniella sp. GW247-6E4 TaxID=3140380 RepID=UPI0033147881
MHTLILSIACSVAVSIFLKLARRGAIHVDQAIFVNYLTAGALCLFLLRPDTARLLDQPAEAWWILSLLGVLLPSIFLVMAAAVRHAGIVLSDAAQRLSLTIPLLAAFLLFGETLSGMKLAGIALAFAALACLLTRPDARARGPAAAGPAALVALLGVWLGYGTIDILFKQLAKSGAAFSSSLLLSFAMAAVLMLAWLSLRRGTPWNTRSLASGVLLGLLNFGNIYFYIRAHQTFPQNPTLVFAAMNIGVISLGTLVGAGIFRERLGRLNALGIALALAAVVLLIPR